MCSSPPPAPGTRRASGRASRHLHLTEPHPFTVSWKVLHHDRAVSTQGPASRIGPPPSLRRLLRQPPTRGVVLSIGVAFGILRQESGCSASSRRSQPPTARTSEVETVTSSAPSVDPLRSDRAVHRCPGVRPNLLPLSRIAPIRSTAIRVSRRVPGGSRAPSILPSLIAFGATYLRGGMPELSLGRAGAPGDLTFDQAGFVIRSPCCSPAAIPHRRVPVPPLLGQALSFEAIGDPGR